MSSVYGLIVTKDECDRYLQSCLEWHTEILDGILVYDDQSSDRTKEIAIENSAQHYVRPDSIPTFMEHEGRFRQHSLDILVETFSLVEGDWIAVVDTDEFLVTPNGLVAENLSRATEKADRVGAKSLRVPRPELWSLNPAFERTDGFWGGIKCTRIFRWEPGGKLRDAAMGCGNEPTYVGQSKSFQDHNVSMIHVGYVAEEDRVDKYRRYSSLLNHGHNNNHIESILGIPKLRPFSGYMPEIWRGLR